MISNSIYKIFANSVLYYDEAERATLFTVINSVLSNYDIKESNFKTFIDYYKAINFNGISEKSEERKNQVVDAILNLNENNPSSISRDNFKMWMISVAEINTNFELAEDIKNHFLWEVIKDNINTIDTKDIEWEDKIKYFINLPNTYDNFTVNNDNDFRNLDSVTYDDEVLERYTTGVKELDADIHIKPTNFVIFAARPGVGKSTLLLNSAIENAKNGVKCLYISLEMNIKQLFERIFNYVNEYNLRERNLNPDGTINIKGIKSDISKFKNSKEFKTINENLKIYDSLINGDTIVNKINDLVKSEDVKIVYIDYIGLIRFPSKDEWGSIRLASNTFKSLCMSNNITIFTASQVTRSSVDVGVELTELYGSSTLEQDADIIISLEVDQNRIQNSNAMVAVKILKHREGKLNSYNMNINYNIGKIMENRG